MIDRHMEIAVGKNGSMADDMVVYVHGCVCACVVVCVIECIHTQAQTQTHTLTHLLAVLSSHRVLSNTTPLL